MGSLRLQIDLSKYQPMYSEKDKERAKEWGFTLDHNSLGWKCNAHGTVLIPEALLDTVLKHIHDSTRYRRDATLRWIQKYIMGPHLQKTIQRVTWNCMICAKNNPKTAVRPPQMGTQPKGTCPTEDWQVEFTQMPRVAGNFRYLLVCVDTFSGWVEAYPPRTETAFEVVKDLLKEIIPRFGLPNTLQSDNGPAFVSSRTQQVSKALRIDWKLHSSWRPQSMNGFIHSLIVV